MYERGRGVFHHAGLRRVTYFRRLKLLSAVYGVLLDLLSIDHDLLDLMQNHSDNKKSLHARTKRSRVRAREEAKMHANVLVTRDPELAGQEVQGRRVSE